MNQALAKREFKFIKTVIVALMSLLQGCASTFQGAPEWSTAIELKNADPLHDRYLKRYYGARSDVVRQQIRNEFIEVRVGMIDRAYASFRQNIYSERVGSAVGVDIATILLTAIGTAVSATGVKTATNAISGGLVGSKASIDKNAYFDRTLSAMLSQMDGMRAQIRVKLLDGMLVGIERYPLMEAASDLESYYHAGTIAGAITGITSQATAEKATAEAKLKARLPDADEISRKLKSLGFNVSTAVRTQSTSSLERCVDSEGRINANLREPLDKWLAVQPNLKSTEPLSLLDFFTSREYETTRSAALNDPELRTLIEACGQ